MRSFQKDTPQRFCSALFNTFSRSIYFKRESNDLKDLNHRLNVIISKSIPSSKVM